MDEYGGSGPPEEFAGCICPNNGAPLYWIWDDIEESVSFFLD